MRSRTASSITLIGTLGFALQGTCGWADSAVPLKATRDNVAEILTFEVPQIGGLPNGWQVAGDANVNAIAVVRDVVHSGEWAARIKRDANSVGAFSGLNVSIPIDFPGSKIELRGFLRTQDVSGFAGLWMREDGSAQTLEFNNMAEKKLNGTTDWNEYAIELPLNPEARRVFVGALLAGSGTVWIDDLQLRVDGRPVAALEIAEPLKTAFDRDHEFDTGSRIAASSLSPAQIDNVWTLGKVWGFLKYHHPAIAAGKYHFDYEMVRVLPLLLAAKDRRSGNIVIEHWIEQLGTVERCRKCSQLRGTDLALRPDLNWIRDTAILGDSLSSKLKWIYRNRSGGNQFYASLHGAGEVSFDHELVYQRVRFPDPGFQILALFRFWNMIEYWYPYRDLESDWDEVLRTSIPPFASADSLESYKRELLLLIARIRDTHANLWSSLDARPPVGDCMLPVSLRFIEGQLAVTGYSGSQAGRDSGLQLGDAILELGGVAIQAIVKDVSKYYADSNEAALRRDLARSISRGPCGELPLTVLRGSDKIPTVSARVPIRTLDLTIDRRHDRPGDTFQMISDDVAYIKLSSIKAGAIPEMIARSASTRGLIIDIRNYPADFVAYVLTSHLIDRNTVFSMHTFADLENPGAFRWRAAEPVKPDLPHYAGKVVILVDETTQSAAEYSAMALRSVPGAVVIGSDTAGADGNFSPIPLPGGLRSIISGIGVFYPDKRPAQQIGIIPDIVVRPTLQGVRAGRDEVLDAAIREASSATAH